MAQLDGRDHLIGHRVAGLGERRHFAQGGQGADGPPPQTVELGEGDPVGFEQAAGSTRVETGQADLLSGLLAIAVFAFFKTIQRLVDLANQFAVTVPRSQLETVLRLTGRALGFVADVPDFVL